MTEAELEPNMNIKNDLTDQMRSQLWDTMMVWTNEARKAEMPLKDFLDCAYNALLGVSVRAMFGAQRATGLPEETFVPLLMYQSRMFGLQEMAPPEEVPRSMVLPMDEDMIKRLIRAHDAFANAMTEGLS